MQILVKILSFSTDEKEKGNITNLAITFNTNVFIKINASSLVLVLAQFDLKGLRSSFILHKFYFETTKRLN